MTAMSRDYGDVGDPLNPCHPERRPRERSDQGQVEGTSRIFRPPMPLQGVLSTTESACVDRHHPANLSPCPPRRRWEPWLHHSPPNSNLHGYCPLRSSCYVPRCSGLSGWSFFKVWVFPCHTCSSKPCCRTIFVGRPKEISS
jgi:hypothetical protein